MKNSPTEITDKETLLRIRPELIIEHYKSVKDCGSCIIPNCYCNSDKNEKETLLKKEWRHRVVRTKNVRRT